VWGGLGRRKRDRSDNGERADCLGRKRQVFTSEDKMKKEGVGSDKERPCACRKRFLRRQSTGQRQERGAAHGKDKFLNFRGTGRGQEIRFGTEGRGGKGTYEGGGKKPSLITEPAYAHMTHRVCVEGEKDGDLKEEMYSSSRALWGTRKEGSRNLRGDL